jgi:hypothetical protein
MKLDVLTMFASIALIFALAASWLYWTARGEKLSVMLQPAIAISIGRMPRYL